ncbi:MULTISPECIES: IclR family transcriptional regulator [Vibrio]|jgi:DNA-binding IclR family transcriptional regulator|uniref:HTH-type transcriptional repressor AllR n=2 Tax=Gammaproteobacteria TaxID=1236 RepID=A0A2J8H6J5_VIBDI|nr:MULTISPECIES: IclR family transcriptional regulator [Vibrio]MCF7362341.1 IclR family transcriptional regulator [Vibrio sp. A1-b2]MCZ4371604.1 IclR family transcriptional regulator [Vibrio diazotrophicus]PNH83057.1 IclR family transcriptional regulator [Vibrio diazotrophicus]PNH93898.1 IclR family transcriptional regulator [Vibrio diazotrophicus]PNH98722.1 IclR family transcriptional regulator [Vibrio diazotrophicus]
MNELKLSTNQVNEKSLQLLMQVAVNSEPVSAKTLSEQLQVPLSSLYRHLKLLKEWSLIEESPYDKTLIIGPAALLLMHSYETSQHNLDEVDAVLTRLQKQTGEMAAFMVPVGYRALCVIQKESMQALRCSYVQGQSQPLLRGASSKAMLAFMPTQRCEKILRHFGQEEQLDKWQVELEKIRQRGYAVSTSEIDPGVSGISAPVMKGSKLIGAITVMAPAHRVDANKQRIILHVLQAARALPPER